MAFLVDTGVMATLLMVSARLHIVLPVELIDQESAPSEINDRSKLNDSQNHLLEFLLMIAD